mmetsp:Transcript_43241/g.133582  ORF Transcript_43241/g.133582 Transcript_43241/m.133582 type:complete len:264 (-) Transcript_43241:512-1303(-)
MEPTSAAKKSETTMDTNVAIGSRSLFTAARPDTTRICVKMFCGYGESSAGGSCESLAYARLTASISWWTSSIFCERKPAATSCACVGGGRKGKSSGLRFSVLRTTATLSRRKSAGLSGPDMRTPHVVRKSTAFSAGPKYASSPWPLSSSTESKSEKMDDRGWWIEKMTVAPCRESFRSRWSRCSAVKVSRPVVGSSRKIRLGSVTSSTPIAARFFSPPETPRIVSPPILVSFTWSMPSSCMMRDTLALRSSSVVPLGRRSCPA